MRIAVVGAGIVGLAVTYEAVRSGGQVDCYEAATPMAARSCGDTRIFRLAHDRPVLVDRARQARRGWQEWSAAAGVPLVGDEGTVVSGDVHGIAAAMSEAGAPFEVVDEVPSLPATAPVGPFLVDGAGGVIQAAATGRFLTSKVGDRIVREAVSAVHAEDGAAILEIPSGPRRYDGVVVAAGVATPTLVATLGVRIPTRLKHHLRITVQLRDEASQPPCWIDRSQAWRPGFTSYGQLSAPGRWAVGGHLPDEDTDWNLPREDAEERARGVLSQYVGDHVTGCEPAVVDSIYCESTGLGDGVSSAQVGSVIAVWGDNLFKLAPVIGRTLAAAVAEQSLPDDLVTMAHSRSL